MIFKRKRTLKKRIRRTINYCVLFTIVLFSCFILAMASMFIKIQTELLCNNSAQSISQTMNSSYFLKQMSIRDIKDLNPESENCKEWFASLDKRSKQGLVTISENKNFKTSDGTSTEDNLDILSMNSLIDLKITLNDKVIYYNSSDSSPLYSDAEDKKIQSNSSLLNYFNTINQQPIYDLSHKQVGTVTSSANVNFIINIFGIIFVIIIVFSLFVFIFNKVIIRIVTNPIIIPLKRLNETINSISEGDFDNIMNSRVNVKKPLQEIDDLAASTNKVIEKMKDYNEILTAQNEELEAQNEELVYSKGQIQDQQAMLVQIENMASIGQLTAAITHEINTPLGAVSSNSQMYEMFINMLKENPQIAGNEELSQLVEEMSEINSVSIMACKRVSEIIRSLKTFTHLDQAEFQETNIIESLKSVLILSSNLWKKKITIHEEYCELQTIRCYSGLLNQVFMNILVNAIQAIEDKGDIYIKTYNDTDNMYISIRDTGSGISDENLTRIFDMGFTTKGSGIGMGLGLAICYNIVKKHNGEINVKSELDVGTEFTVSIPINIDKT